MLVISTLISLSCFKCIRHKYVVDLCKTEDLITERSHWCLPASIPGTSAAWSKWQEQRKGPTRGMFSHSHSRGTARSMKQLFPEISHELHCLEPVQCCCGTMVLRGVEEATSVSSRAVVGTNHWSWHGSNIACKQFPFSALKSYQQLLRGMGAVTAGRLW